MADGERVPGTVVLTRDLRVPVGGEAVVTPVEDVVTGTVHALHQAVLLLHCPMRGGARVRASRGCCKVLHIIGVIIIYSVVTPVEDVVTGTVHALHQAVLLFHCPVRGGCRDRASCGCCKVLHIIGVIIIYSVVTPVEDVVTGTVHALHQAVLLLHCPVRGGARVRASRGCCRVINMYIGIILINITITIIIHILMIITASIVDV